MTEVYEKCINDLDESDPSENLFTLSPNPSSTQISIETKGLESEFQISIFNFQGQEVQSGQIADRRTVIDISILPAGIYYVRMKRESAVGIQKFIKTDRN